MTVIQNPGDEPFVIGDEPGAPGNPTPTSTGGVQGTALDLDFEIGQPLSNIRDSLSSVKAISTEYIHVSVATFAVTDGSVQDPTPYKVELAFMTNGDPTDADWVEGEWIERTINNVTTYYGRTLVGPSSDTVQLISGNTFVYIRVTTDIEVVVMRSGQLTVQ